MQKLKNILLLLATIIIFLILFEVLFRVFNIAPDYGPLKGLYQKDDALDFKMTPNFTGKFVRQEFNINIFTNSNGLRDAEYGAKKQNDFRILELGDSFTWGAYGTELNQTFAKILEKKLNEKSNGLNYQVINAGVPGYGTDQELLYLKNDGYKFNPDIVMVNFFVGNDFLDNSRTHELTVKKGYLVSNSPRQNALENMRNFLIMHFHSYRLIEKGTISLFNNFIQKYVKGKVQYDEYESKLFLKPASSEMNGEFSKTKIILDEMNSYLKSKNIKFVIVIIPLSYQVDENQKETFIKNNLDKKDFDMQQPQKIIIEWARKNNVEVIDLLPDLSKLNNNGDLYWKLNAHFNAKGNEAAGNIIYNNLVSRNITK